MKEENAIEVRNVHKKFKVYLDKGSELKERLLFRNRNRYEERWVLNGISFDVKKGEAIGLIGHNGCGKSTTLKLLTRILYPDQGTIEMKGRVSSLIELGAGFHPDMSGRENIYTNASIFGLTKKEIDERMEDIIAFSELEEFLDNPVRTYSSGMYMRLAFAVAINVDADILLIDEILAVGDVNFQAKCFNRLREIKAEGTTIVIVSHSMSQIEQICDRSIWIHEGKIKAEGTPREVHPEYLDFMGEQRQEIANKELERQEAKKKQEKIEEKNKEKEVTEKEEENIEQNIEKNVTQNIVEKKKDRWGNGMAKITGITLKNEKGEKSVVFKSGQSITIELEYEAEKELEDVVIGIGIFRSDGIHCYGTNTQIDQLEHLHLNKKGKILLELSQVNLLEAEYFMDFALQDQDGESYDYYGKACKIEIYSNISDVGIVRLKHKWTIK